MTSTFQISTQEKSLFVVSRRQGPVDQSTLTLSWLSSDNTGGLESGYFYDPSGATFTYALSRHPGWAVELAFDSAIDTAGYAELATFVNSATDLSANYVGLNGVAQSTIYQALASNYNTSNISYYLGNYFATSTLNNTYDLAELILYDSALSPSNVSRVEEYLINRWAITAPPAPAFSPLDISGLTIWFDATNSNTITTDASGALLTWSNLGSAGQVASSNTGSVGVKLGIASKDNVFFPTNTDLVWSTVTLNYLDRTQFVVFQTLTDLSGAVYPYVAFVNSETNSCMQSGGSWDSNTNQFLLQMCQQGQNCPVSGSVGENFYDKATLALYVNNSTDISANRLYYNMSSNLNTSTDVGNLFEQSTATYFLNNAAGGDGPSQYLAEILEYNSVLPGSNISSVVAYLSDKWNLNLV
jgi:hypothetical protein